MNIILETLVRRIKQRAYLDTDEEIARWIEGYCEQSNSHKHSVMQAEGSEEMCGSDCCPNDGACEHCKSPIKQSAVWKKLN